jgi:hypothetical protein
MNALDTTRPASARIGIARLAEQVIAADPGVGPTRGGARWLTRDGDRVIDGVVVAAAGSGRVEVDLHLVAYLPPRPLGEQAESLRAALTRAARQAGIGTLLGEIDVTIHDLRERPADAGASAPGEGTS